MKKYVGILTSGGDTPGLNAAIRGIGKAARSMYGMQVIGFRDGFRGMMENRTMELEEHTLSGILTIGGTILGTSRDKPHKMPISGRIMDMTDVIVENYNKHHLDVLVCLGGGGTQKNAYLLMKRGLNIITLPKTIDNDVIRTDITFGFDTALGVATEAIDRLHSTASSHNRIMVVEIMGNKAGWLTLGAGIAGGADTILIPEIPYDINKVAESILVRSKGGKKFSIVAVAEGAMPVEIYNKFLDLDKKIRKTDDKNKKAEYKAEIASLELEQKSNTMWLAYQLEKLTKQEARVTILGHLQRGGTPSAADRVLATRLGTACSELINDGVKGVMVAARGDGTEAVPLEEVAGEIKIVPKDHPWIICARSVGTCLGN
ncbi:6-phosphofructokinase [Bacteroidota bacterium]